MLFDLGKASSYTLFAGIVIVGLTFLPTAPLWTLVPVLIVQAVAQGLFTQTRRAYAQDPDPVANASMWARRYAQICLISGSTWGVGAVLWLPGAGVTHYFFYGFVVSALCMGSVISRAPYPPGFWAYSTAALVPTAAMALLSAEPLLQLSVVLALLYWLALVSWNRKLHAATRQTIALRFDKSDLIERLTRANEAAESRRAEAEQAEARASAANKAKAEFLAILAHEVHMPLNNIVGMTRELQVTAMTDTQRAQVQGIAESGLLLQRLFEDVVDLSRIEADMLDLKREDVDPKDLCRGIIGLARLEAAARNLSLEFDAAPGLPDTIAADPGRVRQVLVNLVSNAIKFTESGGVVVRIAALERDGSVAGVRFSVSDTGIGIPADKTDRLFDPFTGAKDVPRGEAKGGGLGLAICHRLIQLMGGRIGVDSVPGHGSTFWFTLPMAPGLSLQPDGDADAPSARLFDRPDVVSPLSDTSPIAGRPQLEELFDRALLDDLRQEVGPDAIISHLVASLGRILEINRAVEAARRDGNGATLGNAARELKETAEEIGLTGLTTIAEQIAWSVEHGQVDDALKSVPHLQAKMTASWHALQDLYPTLAEQAP